MGVLELGYSRNTNISKLGMFLQVESVLNTITIVKNLNLINLQGDSKRKLTSNPFVLSRSAKVIFEFDTQVTINYSKTRL